MARTSTAARKPTLTAVPAAELESGADMPEATARKSGRTRALRADRLGVVDQVRVAFQAGNRLPTAAGFLLGGFVPVATYLSAHYQWVAGATTWASFAQLATLLVVGGLVFSAITVYTWARLAFTVPAKALGFCVLVEGVMTFSTMPALSVAALVYLVLINGIATGTHLAMSAGRPTGT